MTLKITSVEEILEEINKQRGQNSSGMILVNIPKGFEPTEKVIEEIQAQPGISHVQYRTNILYIEENTTNNILITG